VAVRTRNLPINSEGWRSEAMDCAMVAAVPLLPVGYIVSASRIADRRIILAGYRLATFLMSLVGK
jgi:hypothetical protein